MMDSSDMSPTEWIKIAGKIEEVYYDYDGFVLIMGTDTMAYCASALSFLLENLAKPVVLTGMSRTNSVAALISMQALKSPSLRSSAMRAETSPYRCSLQETRISQRCASSSMTCSFVAIAPPSSTTGACRLSTRRIAPHWPPSDLAYVSAINRCPV